MPVPTITDTQPAEPVPVITVHSAPSTVLASSLHRFTVEQYDKMIHNGTLAQENRIELIEGLLIAKVRRNRAHVVAAKQGFAALSAVLPSGWHVAKEDPITVSNWSKPEPDLASVRGTPRDYLHRDVTPADVALVVEIADSSLTADQLEMLQIYASSNIPFYWIINLVEDQIEVHADPSGSSYTKKDLYGRGEEVPLTFDGITLNGISSTDLLP